MTALSPAALDRAVRWCDHAAVVAGAFTVAIGALTLLAHAWAFAGRGGPSEQQIALLSGKFTDTDTPMAASTGLAFLLTGAVLVFRGRRRAGSPARLFMRLAVWLLVAWCAVELLKFGVEKSSNLVPVPVRVLWSDADLPRPLNQPPMSPLTAGLFLFVGLALALSDGRATLARKGLTAGFACAAILFCLVVLMGYAHHVELLGNFLGTPMALWSATTFAIAGVGLVAVIGPARFPLRTVVGPSTRAPMLRTILPVVFFMLVLDATLRTFVLERYLEGRLPSADLLYDLEEWCAVITSIFDLITLLIVTAAVSYAAELIGGRIDAAEKMRDQAVEEAKKARDAAEAANEDLRMAWRGLRKSREELLKARDAADASNLAKSQFLANMSHELRTPLNAIKGYTEHLQDMATDEGRDDLVPILGHILTSARHQLTLIDDVLDLSKIEAGKVTLLAESLDVAARSAAWPPPCGR